MSRALLLSGSRRSGVARERPEEAPDRSRREIVWIGVAVGVIAVLTKAASFLRAVFTGAIPIAVGLFARRAYHLGVAFFVITLPFLDLFPSQLFGLSGLNTRNLMLAVLIGFIVFRAVRLESHEMKPLGLRMAAPLFLFYGWLLVGVFLAGIRHGVPLGYGLDVVWRIVALSLPLFVGAAAARTGSRPRAFVTGSVLISVGLVALWAVLGHGLKVAAGADPSRIRSSGMMGQPNNFGAFLALALPGFLALAGSARQKSYRVLGWIGGGLCMASLMNTLSRGSILAAGAAIVCVGLMRYRKILAVLILAGVLGGSFLVPAHLYDRFAETVEGTEGDEITDRSIELRMEMYEITPEVWRASPILGNGVGAFPLVAWNLGGQHLARSPHSWYIIVATENGLIGLILCAWLTLAAIVGLWRLRRSSDDLQAAAATALLGSTVALAIVCLFQKPFIDNEMILPFYFLMLGVILGARREGPSTPAPSARGRQPGPKEA